MNYSLASLAKRPRGSVSRLPPIQPTMSTELALLRAARAVNRGLRAHAFNSMLPAYTRLVAQRKASLRDAAMNDDIAGETVLRLLVARLVNVVEGTVRRVLGLEAKRHSAAFRAIAKRALGVDLSAVVREEDLADVLDVMVSRNVALITGMADDVARDVSRVVADGYLRGEQASALRKTLVQRFGVADSRAKLIARDQAATVNSEMSQYRHQQAGLVEYRWRTSADERVRSLHRELNGRRFRYDKPTDAEQGKHPGGPVQCRCTAEAVVTF